MPTPPGPPFARLCKGGIVRASGHGDRA
jgi:hypothetical protein